MYCKLLKSIILSIFLLSGLISTSYADFYVIPVVKKIKNIITVAKSRGDFADPILAMKSITDANETNRYIVKISEGIYDLNETLIMKPYVDIIGTGVGKTILKGEFCADSARDATLIMAAKNTFLSDVSMQNVSSCAKTMAISVFGDNIKLFTLRNVDINHSSTSDYSWAVYVSNSVISVINSDITSTGTDDIRALYLQYSTASVIDSNLTAKDGENSYGVYSIYFPVSIEGSNIIVYDASVKNSGVYINSNIAGGASVISSSYIEADHGADVAVVSNDGYGIMINSQIYGVSGSHKVCIDCTGVGELALDENCTVP